jgi:hypothetical protein
MPIVWPAKWTEGRLNRVLVLLNSLPFKKADKESAMDLLIENALILKQSRVIIPEASAEDARRLLQSTAADSFRTR